MQQGSPSATEFSLGYNVSSETEVNETMAPAGRRLCVIPIQFFGRCTHIHAAFSSAASQALYMSDTSLRDKAGPGQGAVDYDFSEQVGHLLRRAYQRHTALFQQLIPDTQLTAAQFVVLCSIRDVGPCSMSEIVKRTAIDQATVRGIIERLKTRKLLAVRHDESDRRKVLVSLTDEGQALVKHVVPFAFEISERTFGNFNPAERMALLYLLRKMCEGDEND